MPKTAPTPPVLSLGSEFYDPVQAAHFPKLQLRFRNQRWAERVGLGRLTDDEWLKHFGRFQPLADNLPEPLALRYHGHQFRVYNRDLGDGRGFLFAQVRDEEGRLLDLGTKGSGETPYSRRGDGRLTLKGAVREVLATEMLEALGVNTSKTFSVFETGEELTRYDEPSPTRAAVLTRLNHSHVRYGTFQRFAYLRQTKQTAELLKYCIQNFYPHLQDLDEHEQPGAFVREVALRASKTCAGWMIAGFVHGVLNTDNMNITGESFDYGPYRFLPTYDREFTAAYFDESGLYAYGRQPETVMWNLEQLGASFLPLIDERGWAQEPIVDAINTFPAQFNEDIVEAFLSRIGLMSQGPEKDDELFIATFNFLEASQVPYPQFFHDWYGGVLSRERALLSPEAERYKGETFDAMTAQFARFEAQEVARKRLTDAHFDRKKPCSMLIDEIEWIWDAIAKNDDWSRFEDKIRDVRSMGKVYGR